MELNGLYKILNEVLPNQVYYGLNVYDDKKAVTLPFIVYQEVSKRPSVFNDDYLDLYKKNIQVTLVTSDKSLNLEKTLENKLLEHNLIFTLLSEFKNQDKSLSRVYEIEMEELINGK